MEKAFITVLRAVALVCLVIAICLVVAAIVKWRADLLGEAVVFYIARVLFIYTAKDEEVYLEEKEKERQA